MVGPAADGGADLRPLPAGPGSSDPGAADGRAAAYVSTHHALPVLSEAELARPGRRRDTCAAPAARADLGAVIGLLASCGLRIGEACRLDAATSIWTRVMLVLRTKFGKSRIVPVHPTTASVVARYLRAAATCSARPRGMRRRLPQQPGPAAERRHTGDTFKQIVPTAGITAAPGGRPAQDP